MAVSAYVLIQTEVGKAASVADHVRDISGVVSADDENGNLQIFIADMTNLKNANPLQLTTDAADHYD